MKMMFENNNDRKVAPSHGMKRTTLTTGMAGLLAMAICWASDSAKAETPLWKLGLPTFVGKSAEEKAQLGPAFKFPVPDSTATGPTVQTPVAVAFDTGAHSSGSEPQNVLPVTYEPDMVYGSGAVDDSYQIPSLPAAESLPIPGVPNLGVDEAVSSVIGQALATDQVVESAPLEEATQSWYQVPWGWVTRGWQNHAELGLDGSSGNSRTLALQTGLEMKRKTDRYTLGLDFDYRKATNRGITTEDNGRFNLDYDRLFQDSKWSAFGKFGAEWDQFKAFDSRLNLNSGLGYHFIRTDDALFVTRFGAGASKEIGAPDDDWKAEAVFGTEGEYQLNRYNRIKGKVDYFPAWEDFSDYRMVGDVAWEILLDDADNLSLKLSLTDRYDSTPQGAKPNDVYYSLLLLVKF